MYFSDDSIYFETTYSQDERIGSELQQERDKEIARDELVELSRRQRFANFFEKKDHDVFSLPGLKFLKCTHSKIKFSFDPSKVVTHVSKKVIFYCSLKYYKKYKRWNIKKDSFPCNYKWRIYRLFYVGDFLATGDDDVIDIILAVYGKLRNWAQDEEAFRLEKFLRYQEGEDVILDSDDENLFLNEKQRKELHEKRDKILTRMLPTSRFRRIRHKDPFRLPLRLDDIF